MEDRQVHDKYINIISKPRHVSSSDKFMKRTKSRSSEGLDEDVFETVDEKPWQSQERQKQFNTYDVERVQSSNRYTASYGLSRHRSSSDDDERVAARNEIRKKSKEMQHLLMGGPSAVRNDRMRQEGKGNMNNSSSKKSSILSTDVGYVISDNISNGNLTKDHHDRRKDKKSREVTLIPDFSLITGNETCGAVLCEKLFGVIIFQYSNGKTDWQQLPKDSKLVVKSIAEGSKNHALAKVKRGDMLVRINDNAVSWLNFTRLMLSVKRRDRVTLTFQSPRIVGPKSSYRVIQAPEGDFCLAALGKHLSHVQSELSHYPCVVLYLTLSQSSRQNETDAKEDIVYAFPSEEDSLTPLRGLFITLSSSMKDIVCQRANGSVLVLDDKKVNVAYSQCGKDVLVMAMPEKSMSMSSLSNLLNALHSLLVLLFADIKSAFSDCDKLWLDKVLAIMIHEAMGLRSCLTSTSSPSSSSPPPSTSNPSNTLAMSCRGTNVKSLPLSHENKLICDEILSEFESMEFDDYMDREDLFSRRKYLIRGTSLYYKDYLLRSHLTKENQCDVNLFLLCHGFLMLSAREHVDQVFGWQELKSYNIHETVPSSPIGYKPYSSRTFLMLVGMQHYLLAVMIDTGDSNSVTMAGALYPPSLLMEQGRYALTQLETKEVHMARSCEERLKKIDEMIVLASADQLCTVSSPRHRSGSEANGIKKSVGSFSKPPLTPTKATQESPWKTRSKSVETLDEGVESNFQSDVTVSTVMRRQGSKMSFGSNDSAGSGSSSGHPRSKGSRVSSNADLSNISRSISVLQINEPYCGVFSQRICRGREPAIFHFLAIDEGEGVVICPTEGELSVVNSPLQQEVLDNFHAACHKMKHIFASEASLEEENASVNSDNPFASPRLEPKEQGVMFECCYLSEVDKKSQVSLQYWVVGRRWLQPSVQEMYVCFHESTQQCLVEMAFSLGFGT